MDRELALIVPSRGRPEGFSAFLDSWRSTTRGRSYVILCLDDDDESQPQYRGIDPSTWERGLLTFTGPRKGLAEWTNTVVEELFSSPRLFAVGSLGDDHRVVGSWEDDVLDALHELETGIVYGDDGIRGEKLPTACFMTVDIPLVLGWMCPPGIEHLYIDSVWRELGDGAGCLRWLPHVSTPHLHPAAGLAEWDDSYRNSNSPENHERDESAFHRWMAEDRDAAVATIMKLRAEKGL